MIPLLSTSALKDTCKVWGHEVAYAQTLLSSPLAQNFWRWISWWIGEVAADQNRSYLILFQSCACDPVGCTSRKVKGKGMDLYANTPEVQLTAFHSPKLMWGCSEIRPWGMLVSVHDGRQKTCRILPRNTMQQVLLTGYTISIELHIISLQRVKLPKPKKQNAGFEVEILQSSLRYLQVGYDPVCHTQLPTNIQFISCLHLPDSLQDAELNVAGINIIHADAMDGIKIPDLRNGGKNQRTPPCRFKTYDSYDNFHKVAELLVKFHQCHSVAWLCLSTPAAWGLAAGIKIVSPSFWIPKNCSAYLQELWQLSNSAAKDQTKNLQIVTNCNKRMRSIPPLGLANGNLSLHSRCRNSPNEQPSASNSVLALAFLGFQASPYPVGKRHSGNDCW